MNKDKVQNQNILGTLVNKDESGIIAYSDQIYDKKSDRSLEEENVKQNERLDNVEAKDREFQSTLENITKTGEASAASNVTYNHNDSKLDATNVQQAVDEVRKRSNYNDGENIIDFNTIHIITDNPEFICAAVDANDKILYGIKTDGQPYFGVGCPQQVKDYIDEQINKILGTDDITTTIDSLKEIETFLKDFTNSDTLKKLLDLKANVDEVRATTDDIYKKSNPNDSEGNVVDTNTIVSIENNPEYIKVITDNVGKLIEAIGIDGIRKFFAGIEVQGTLQCVTDNPEYIAVWLDNQERIVFGFKINGDPYFGYGIPSQINSVIDTKANKVDIDNAIANINANIADKYKKSNPNDEEGNVIDTNSIKSVINNPEYFKAFVDNTNKLIEAIGLDGVRKFFAGIEIQGISQCVIDNPDYTIAWVDKDNKIVFAIQHDGNPYFGYGVPKQIKDTIDKVNSNVENKYTEVKQSISDMFPITPTDTNFINKTIPGINLFNKYTVVHGFYSYDGITYSPSNTFWCSDFIEVEEGQKYRRTLNTSYFVYAYDANKQPVVVKDNLVYWQEVFESTLIPSGVKYIRVIVSPNDLDTQMVYNQNLHPTEYVPYSYYLLSPDIHIDSPETDDYTPISNNIGTSDVGNLSYQEIDDTDYSQIIMYGQSLSMGWEAPEAIAEDAIQGVFMVGDKVSIGHGNNGQNVLNPLVSTTATSCGENPTVGAMNAFAKLYKRFVSKEQKFIATSCGEGGKSIEQLSKECTNGTNYYNTQFITTLTRTKAAVDNENKTVGCFAILFMQGEYNYLYLSNGGLTPGTDATNDKDTYKQYLLTLKNNMQADIMAQYGQAKKPLFLLYEVAGFFINLKNMSINMAQIEFAQENDDVFLLAPTYPVPDYGGGHLSTNGYRWYGEMMAKSLYNIFIKGLSFYSIMPEKFEVVNDNTIRIDFHVPVLPLVFDTYTKESITDYGFRLFVDDTATAISSLTIKNNSVIIKTESSLTSKKVELTYAGQGRSGSGNLRDSDTYHSLYNYYDDRETSPSKRENYTPKDKNGNYIYGKPYPMFNWCGNFYKLVQESNN